MPRTVRVARVSEVPAGRGRTVQVEGLELAIFNGGDGVFYATSAACPHEGGPLGEGRVSRGAIVCPWHGFDFDPRSGDCRADPELAVTTYPVRVAGDALLVELP